MLQLGYVMDGLHVMDGSYSASTCHVLSLDVVVVLAPEPHKNPCAKLGQGYSKVLLQAIRLCGIQYL